MAVLTNFLKLLKPEKNDYVDVDKHISENYDKIDSKMQELSTSNSGKLNKGAVSSEYDTAKKIEDKIKAAQGTVDDKLDKGNVLEKYNTAEKIGNEIELKQNKTDNTLKTKNKNIPEAINESLWFINPKMIGNTETETDLNTIIELGEYASSSVFNKFLNLPQGLPNAFVLKVISSYGSKGNTTYRIQIIGNRSFGFYYRGSNDGSNSIWTKWTKFTDDNDLYIKLGGLDNVLYIQDAGTKVRGKGYIDKVTGKIYVCKPIDPNLNSINDTTITMNFKLSTNIELSNRIDKSYKNLGEISKLNGKIDVSDYNKIIVFGKQRAETTQINATFYLVKEYQNITLNFFGSDLEGSFTFENNTITLTNLGRNSDGAIQIIAR